MEMQQITGTNPGVRAWTVVNIPVPAVQRYTQVVVTSAGPDTIIFSQPVIHIVQPAIIVENQNPPTQATTIQYQFNPNTPQQFNANQNYRHSNNVNQANDPNRNADNGYQGYGANTNASNHNINRTGTHPIYQTVATQTAPISTNPTRIGSSTTHLRQTTVRANITSTRIVSPHSMRTQPPPSSHISSNHSRMYENHTPSTFPNQMQGERANNGYMGLNNRGQGLMDRNNPHQNAPLPTSSRKRKTYQFGPSNMQGEQEIVTRYFNQRNSMRNAVNINNPNLSTAIRPQMVQSPAVERNLIQNNVDESCLNETAIHMLPVSQPHQVLQNTIDLSVRTGSQKLISDNVMDGAGNSATLKSNENRIGRNISDQTPSIPTISIQTLSDRSIPSNVAKEELKSLGAIQNNGNLINSSTAPSNAILFQAIKDPAYHANGKQNGAHELHSGGIVQLPVNQPPPQIPQNKSYPSQNPKIQMTENYLNGERLNENIKNVYRHINLANFYRTKSCESVYHNDIKQNNNGERIRLLVNEIVTTGQPTNSRQNEGISENIDSYKPQAINTASYKLVNGQNVAEKNQNFANVHNVAEKNQELAVDKNVIDKTQKLGNTHDVNEKTLNVANNPNVNKGNQRRSLETRDREHGIKENTTYSSHVDNQATLKIEVNNHSNSNPASVISQDSNVPHCSVYSNHDDTTILRRSSSIDSNVLSCDDRSGSMNALDEHRCHSTLQAKFKYPESTSELLAKNVSSVSVSFAANPASLPSDVATSTPKTVDPVNTVDALHHVESETKHSNNHNLPEKSIANLISNICDVATNKFASQRKPDVITNTVIAISSAEPNDQSSQLHKINQETSVKKANRVIILENEVFDYSKYRETHRTQCSTPNKTVTAASHEAHGSTIKVETNRSTTRKNAESAVENEPRQKKRRVEDNVKQESGPNMTKRCNSDKRKTAKKVVNKYGQTSRISKNIYKHSTNLTKTSAIFDDVQPRNAVETSIIDEETQQLNNDIEMSYEQGTGEVSSMNLLNQRIQTEPDDTYVKFELLTHVIGGNVIQESNVAFPVRQQPSPEFSVRHAGIERRRCFEGKPNPTERLLYTAPAYNIRVLRAMSERDVYKWLCENGCKEVAEILLEQEIDGEALTLASVRDLSGIGLPWIDALLLYSLSHFERITSRNVVNTHLVL